MSKMRNYEVFSNIKAILNALSNDRNGAAATFLTETGVADVRGFLTEALPTKSKEEFTLITDNDMLEWMKDNNEVINHAIDDLMTALNARPTKDLFGRVQQVVDFPEQLRATNNLRRITGTSDSVARYLAVLTTQEFAKGGIMFTTPMGPGLYQPFPGMDRFGNNPPAFPMLTEAQIEKIDNLLSEIINVLGTK